MKIDDTRTGLVTGGTKGIGKAIALSLLERGLRVAVNYYDDEDAAAGMKEECAKYGDRVLFMRADVSDWDQVQTMFGQVFDRFANVDILVNNAGITRDRSFLKMSNEDWNRVLAVNLNGPFHCCRMAVPRMVERKWGRIVNIASVVGQVGNFGQTNYAASKAAVIGFTKALARELAPKNVFVNAIAPGFIDTSMTRGIPEPVREKIAQRISIGRFGETTHVASAALFLCADESCYLTGTVVNVDGGYHG